MNTVPKPADLTQPLRASLALESATAHLSLEQRRQVRRAAFAAAHPSVPCAPVDPDAAAYWREFEAGLSRATGVRDDVAGEMAEAFGYGTPPTDEEMDAEWVAEMERRDREAAAVRRTP